MTCEEVVEFLMAYTSGELPETERAAFEEHLAECPDCVSYLHSYEETVRLGKAACAGDDLDEVPEELIRAILAARRKGR
jgi:anti-sigma factor RsiW